MDNKTTTTETTDTGSAKTPLIAVIAGGAIITLLSWFVLIEVYRDNFGAALSDKQEVWGQFGEYFAGLLNPILGTITLFGILYTVYLQREVLFETRRAERNQRTLNQQQAFESAFFQMLNSINKRVAETTFEVPGHLINGVPPSDPVISNGAEAFALFIGLFNIQGLQKVQRGDFPDEDPNDALRRLCKEQFAKYDHVLGPVLRSLADLLIFIDDHFHNQGVNSETPSLPAEFYARVAISARTRLEMKVFAMYAMYAGSGLAPNEVDHIAREYNIFRIIEDEWCGRDPFLPPSVHA
jgi:hypothetical protein